MNIEQALVTIWNASTGVKAVLGDPPRIYPGIAPQTAQRPFAVYNIIYERPIYHTGGESARTERLLQIDIYAKTNMGARAVEAALRALLSGGAFTVANGPAVYCQKSNEISGADFGEASSEGLHRITVDYRVWHTL